MDYINFVGISLNIWTPVLLVRIVISTTTHQFTKVPLTSNGTRDAGSRPRHPRLACMGLCWSHDMSRSIGEARVCCAGLKQLGAAFGCFKPAQPDCAGKTVLNGHITSWLTGTPVLSPAVLMSTHGILSTGTCISDKDSNHTLKLLRLVGGRTS